MSSCRPRIDGKEWWTRAVTTGKPLQKKDAAHAAEQDRRRHLDLRRSRACNTTARSRNGTPAKAPSRFTPPIRAREYVFLNNTACNLASLNLMKFKREDGTFDVERFKAAVRIFITAQEILVDNASYPTKEIAENSHIFRTLGLGYANLGSLIMSYGLPYDSDEGRALAGAITAIMTGHAYEQSAEIAGVMGPFKGYRDARCAARLQAAGEGQRRFDARRHQAASRCRGSNSAERGVQLSERRSAQLLGSRAGNAASKHGYRNAQVTVLAPTGTIAFLMDCDTTGVEPDIALVKYKLLAGGGMLKIVNRTVPEALRAWATTKPKIERIIAHIEKFDTIEDVEEERRRRSQQRPEARASAGVRLRLQGLSRQAQHPLHGASEDDGRRAAVHQRRDLQDRQHAERTARSRTFATPTFRPGRWA